jgi:homoserine kinase
MGLAEQSVRVRVPATSANLGPGYDTLGLALGLHDEVEVAVTSSGLDIEVSGEGAGDVADAGEKHLVVRALRVAFDDLGLPQPPGLALRCVNQIPHGRGLGSSAAAIVAGLVAARGLAGASTRPEDVLPLANALEGHPDNVAPCLFGGLAIAWIANEAPAAGYATGLPESTPTESTPMESTPMESGPTTSATGNVPGAEGAVPGLAPGEGAAIGDSGGAPMPLGGTPRTWGGPRGGHPPGGKTPRGAPATR